MIEGYHTTDTVTFNVEHDAAAEASTFHHSGPAKTMGGSIRLIRS
jgi:hypothetical protein